GVHQKVDHVFGDQRRDIGAAFDHFVNGGDQFFGGGLLDQIAGSAYAKSLRRELHISVHSQEDDLGRDAVPPQLSRGVKPVEQRHGDVGYDHFRVQIPGRFQQSAPVVDGADEVKLVFQQAPQSFGHDSVIIGK